MRISNFSAHLSYYTFKAISNFHSFILALHTGLNLGFLGEKGMDAIDEMYYNNTGDYTNDDYTLSGLFPWENETINEHFKDLKNILIIGAGGGREAIALYKEGYAVDCYECNPKLADFGNLLFRKNDINITIRSIRRNSVPDNPRKYDGILLGWASYTHIRGTQARIKFLRDLYPFMHKDSRLMISFLVRTKTSRQEKIAAEIANFIRRLGRRPEVEHGDRLIPLWVHYFTEDEITQEFVKGGFKVISFKTKDYGRAVACML